MYMAASFTIGVFADYPMAFQASAWYAGYGYAALGLVGVMALYGFNKDGPST